MGRQAHMVYAEAGGGGFDGGPLPKPNSRSVGWGSTGNEGEPGCDASGKNDARDATRGSR